MDFLLQLEEYLKDSFNQGWVESVLNENEENEKVESTEDIHALITSKVVTIEYEFYILINCSILSGEFTFIDQAHPLITSCKHSVRQASDNLGANANLTTQTEESIYAFFDYIISCLDIYHELLLQIRRKLDNTESYIYLSEQEEKKPLSDEYKTKRKVFFNNCLTQFFDLSLSTDDLSGLIDLKDNCLNEKRKGFQYQEILEHIVQKVEYLINKIAYRLHCDRIERKNQSQQKYIIAVDYKLKELTANPNIDPNIYHKFNEVTDSHYNNHNSPINTRKEQEIDAKLFGSGTDLLFKEFHFKTKEYKDRTQNLEQLKNLRDHFNEKHNLRLNTPFDERARIIAQIYLSNNYLSLLIEKNSGYEIIKSVYDGIHNRQKISGINNFFVYKKYSTYLIKSIKNGDYTSLKEFEDLLNELKNSNDELQKAIKWCDNRNFVPFQLPFQECLADECDLNGIKIRPFIYSSFVLPINYKSEYENKESLIREERLLELSYVKAELSQHGESQVKVFKERMEERETKYIEILGIFSAIALFAIGSINFFDNGDELDYGKALLFLLTFAISMTSFIVILKMIISGFKKLWPWVILISLYLISLTFLLIRLGKNDINITF